MIGLGVDKNTIRDGGSTGLYAVNTVDMVDTVGTVDIVYTVSLTKMAFSLPSVQALPVPKTKTIQFICEKPQMLNVLLVLGGSN